jgi:ATP-dependent Clp protease ATP-binding subunit ClpC
MFEKFTERAKHIMQLARQESRDFSHDYIGTEHILCGIIQEDGGIGADVLRQIDVNLDAVRSKLEGLVEPTTKKVDTAKLPFTPMTKKALESAITEAASMGHSYIGGEHLLLGIVGDEDTVASRILVSLGTDLDSIRAEIHEMMGTQRPRPKARPSKKKAKSRNSALNQFGRDLTELAAEGKLDPVIGRETEIDRVTLILARRNKNNPILLGEPGVGKTAIAEGIALKIASGNAPEMLLNHRLIALDLAAMVAGTKYRGQFEERIKAVLNEVTTAKNVVLFIDEIHTLVGAGAAEGAIDAANVLKPALARGELRCIGATTLDEYRKSLEKDGALARRFQKVIVNPPSPEETIEILEGVQDKYETFHKVTYTREAIREAVEMSERYISNRFLPDKALDVIDEAGARLSLEIFRPAKLREAEKSLKRKVKDKENAVAAQDFEKAAELRDEIAKLKKERDSFKTEWRKFQSKDTKGTVDKELIAVTVAKMTGIPVNTLTETEVERLLNMEEELNKVIIGQKIPKQTVCKALRRSRAGLKNPKRPVGCFLLLGPTGVGKTLLAKALAQFMFSSEDALITLDMSEYMEKHSVSRLFGAPPGYVGYEEGGQLTEAVRRKPYSVVLFDEIEKAHPDVFNSLLQIMEEGKLTDSMGRVVDFSNAVIMLTSNVGSEAIQNKTSLGFGMSSGGDEKGRIEQQVSESLNRAFKPEFINRLDAKLVFLHLTKEELHQVLDLEISKVTERLSSKGITFKLTDGARDFLMEKGWSPEFGARPLRRAIEQYVEDVLADAILKNRIAENQSVDIDFNGSELFVVLDGESEESP